MSQQKTFSAVLDHLYALTELHSSVDSQLLKEGINQVPLDIYLQEASQAEMLQAICHALDRRVWWHADSENNILFTQSTLAPPQGGMSNKMYSSTIRDVKRADDILHQALKPWLSMPKAGIGLMAPQRQWSASLNPEGHQQLQRLLGILEKNSSDIPHLLNPKLKRVLPLTTDITATNWAAMAAQMQQQLKCSISLSSELLRRRTPTQALQISACLAENIPAALTRLGVEAAWEQNVLCIGVKPIQTWSHPSQTHSIIVPLKQYPSDQQQRIAQHCRGLVSAQYWEQDASLLQLLPDKQQLLLVAHDSVLAIILDELHHIDLNGSLP